MRGENEGRRGRVRGKRKGTYIFISAIDPPYQSYSQLDSSIPSGPNYTKVTVRDHTLLR